MEQKTDFQVIGEESKTVWSKFWETVEPYRAELWNYCRKITGSPWYAEDLLHDTLLKAFASLSALAHRSQPLKTRSYLFRVATNHWIDQCRKNKFTIDTERNVEKIAQDITNQSIEIENAFETLVKYLSPRQTVVLILMDSFKFTAKETADLIATTEGAVHALLHRSRKKLLDLKKAPKPKQMNQPTSRDEKVIVQAFIEAFNARDYHGVASLMDDHAVYNFHTHSSQEYGKDTISKYSLATTFEMANMPIAKEVELWGKPVVLFITETKNGRELNDVNRLTIEDGKNVKWGGYYFCRELMKEAADEFEIPLELLDTSYLA